MPTYDFRCKTCKELVEDVFTNLSERDDPRECPWCNGPLERLLGAASPMTPPEKVKDPGVRRPKWV